MEKEISRPLSFQELSIKVPLEFQPSLREMVRRIAEVVYILRGGGESSQEQKDADYFKAEEIAFRIYMKNQNCIQALREVLDGNLPKDFDETKYFQILFQTKI